MQLHDTEGIPRGLCNKEHTNSSDMAVGWTVALMHNVKNFRRVVYVLCKNECVLGLQGYNWVYLDTLLWLGLKTDFIWLWALFWTVPSSYSPPNKAWILGIRLNTLFKKIGLLSYMTTLLYKL